MATVTSPPIMVNEGESLTFTILRQVSDPDVFSIRWDISFRGFFPAAPTEFNVLTGTADFTAGDTEVTITIPTIATSQGGYDRNFQIAFTRVVNDVESFVSSHDINIIEPPRADDAPRTDNVILTNDNPNVIVFGDPFETVVDGQFGDDLFIITPAHYGNLLIVDINGQNTIRFDGGVTIVNVVRTEEDQFENQAAIWRLFTGADDDVIPTIEQLIMERVIATAADIIDYMSVVYTLDTGGTISINMPRGNNYRYQIGEGEVLTYVQFRDIVGLPTNEDPFIVPFPSVAPPTTDVFVGESGRPPVYTEGDQGASPAATNYVVTVNNPGESVDYTFTVLDTLRTGTSALFTLTEAADGNSATLSVNANAVLEVGVYLVAVQVTDGGGAVVGHAVVSIRVDHDAATLTTDSTTPLVENAGTDVVVATIGIGADLAGLTPTYTTSDDRFVFDSTTGQLQTRDTAATFDYETEQSIDVTITATYERVGTHQADFTGITNINRNGADNTNGEFHLTNLAVAQSGGQITVGAGVIFVDGTSLTNSETIYFDATSFAEPTEAGFIVVRSPLNGNENQGVVMFVATADANFNTDFVLAQVAGDGSAPTLNTGTDVASATPLTWTVQDTVTTDVTIALTNVGDEDPMATTPITLAFDQATNTFTVSYVIVDPDDAADPTQTEIFVDWYQDGTLLTGADATDNDDTYAISAGDSGTYSVVIRVTDSFGTDFDFAAVEHTESVSFVTPARAPALTISTGTGSAVAGQPSGTDTGLRFTINDDDVDENTVTIAQFVLTGAAAALFEVFATGTAGEYGIQTAADITTQTITDLGVTFTDSDSNAVSGAFASLDIADAGPQQRGAISDVVIVSGGTYTIDLAQYFTNSDGVQFRLADSIPATISPYISIVGAATLTIASNYGLVLDEDIVFEATEIVGPSGTAASATLSPQGIDMDIAFTAAVVGDISGDDAINFVISEDATIAYDRIERGGADDAEFTIILGTSGRTTITEQTFVDLVNGSSIALEWIQSLSVQGADDTITISDILGTVTLAGGSNGAVPTTADTTINIEFTGPAADDATEYIRWFDPGASTPGNPNRGPGFYAFRLNDTPSLDDDDLLDFDPDDPLATNFYDDSGNNIVRLDDQLPLTTRSISALAGDDIYVIDSTLFSGYAGSSAGPFPRLTIDDAIDVDSSNVPIGQGNLLQFVDGVRISAIAAQTGTGFEAGKKSLLISLAIDNNGVTQKVGELYIDRVADFNYVFNGAAGDSRSLEGLFDAVDALVGDELTNANLINFEALWLPSDVII